MKRLHSFLKLTVAFGAASSAFALDLSFSGNFQKDNDVALFNFSISSDRVITVFSSSWDDGGFDPILGIWDSAGNRLSEQDDGHNTGTTSVNGTDFTHGTWDSYYTVNLAAGSYIASVTQFDNFSVSALLADGFRYDGAPNFTFTQGYGPQPYFNGVQSSNDARTGNYVFHLLNVDNATHQPPTVPDGASTVGLLSAAVAGMAMLRRRRA